MPLARADLAARLGWLGTGQGGFLRPPGVSRLQVHLAVAGDVLGVQES